MIMNHKTNLRCLLALVVATHWKTSHAFAPSSAGPAARGVLPMPPRSSVITGSGSSQVVLHANPFAAIALDRPRQVRHQNSSPSNEQRNEERFERTASRESQAQAPCIIEIHGVQYNLTAWAKAHPGGEKILLKFHDKDATKAFEAADHSTRAYEMLQDFAITSTTTTTSTTDPVVTPSPLSTSTVTTAMTKSSSSSVPRWRKKLFTKEDPIGVHKYLGIFCLLHFVFRFGQMYVGDPSAGLGTRLGHGARIGPALCLLPHALLSLSSLIFHTVPKERVVGQPMIWQEYRAHNIAFGVRSVIAAYLAWMSYYFGHTPLVRRIALWGSGAAILLANYVADEGTKRLRVDTMESTTATMPYWEGCSMQTQKRFKSFYAYCQFMATLACLAVCNPAWPLAALIAIQLASLLMTLVRKGLISAKAYHIGYTISLIMPWFVGLRDLKFGPEFLGMALLGWALYQMRRQGFSKYAMWIPLVVARIAVGDQLLHWDVY